MSEEKKSRGVPYSFLRNSFSRRKPSSRNVHTLNDEVSMKDANGVSGDGPGRSGDTKSTGESNVSKIMKLIPGLCLVKKASTETFVKGNDGKNLQRSDDCLLINVTPPVKKVISGKVASRMSYSRRVSKPKTKKSRGKIIATSSNYLPRLSINGICLNIKISGPIYDIIGNICESNIRNIVTLSGAGISTAAGIPDFRSPDSGMYEKLKDFNLPYAQAIFERKFFDKNPNPLFSLLTEMLAKEYKPTITHYFIKLLEEKGLLLRHITQNVDGLERLAGISYNKVVEAHGSVYASRCMKCGTEYDLQWLRDRLVIQGKPIPQCQNPDCLGIVKPNIVLFGETLNPRFTASVRKDVPKCDLLIIMGTSLVVEPFASSVKKVSRSCPRIIVNNMPVGEHLGIVYEGSSGYINRKNSSELRDVFIQGSCDEGVLHLCKLFKWERDLESLIKRCEPGIHIPRSPSPNKEENQNKEQPHSSKEDDVKREKSLSFAQNDQTKNENPPEIDCEKQTIVDEISTPQPSVGNRAKKVWERITSQVRKPRR